MKNIISIAILLISLSVIMQDAYSQTAYSDSKKFTSNWFINGSVGTSQFYGDMSTENPIQKIKTDTRIGVSLSAGKMFWPFLGVRGQIYYGRLKSTRRSLNEYYESMNVVEANISLILNFADMVLGYKQDRFFTIYGTLGIGIANWQSRRFNMTNNNLIANIGYSGNGLKKLITEFDIPAGVGLNFRLSKHWSATVENTWHIVNSDILDTKKGGFKYDEFIYTSVGLSYKFNLVKQKEIIVEPQIIIPVSPPQEAEIKEEIIEVEPVIEEISEPVIIEEQPPTPESEDIIVTPVVTVPPLNEAEYRVQIRASYDRPLTDEELKKFKLDSYEIMENQGDDGWYRYTVGSFSSREEANDLMNVMKYNHSISDAFVVTYKGGQRSNMPKVAPPAKTAKPKDEGYSSPSGKSYRVQILCVNTYQEVNPSDLQDKYNISYSIYQVEENGLYKYLTTEFNSYQKANEARKAMINSGISDAFIATYVNGNRL